MKKLFLLILTMLILSTTVSAQTTITTLDYQEEKIVAVQGNLSLLFNISDTGEQDVLILWSLFDSDTNLTIVMLKSMEVEYDHTFINNTKNYYFKDNNSGYLYIVKVDYSSIQVPESIKNYLSRLLADKNQTIAELQSYIIELNTTISNLELDKQNIIVEREALQNEIDRLKNISNPLESELENITANISFYENKITELDNEILYRDCLINDLYTALQEVSDGLSFSVAVGSEFEPHYDTYSTFNYLSLIIGIIVSGIMAYIFFSQKKAKTQGDGKAMKILKSLPFIKGATKSASSQSKGFDKIIEKLDDEELNEDPIPFEPVDENKPKEEVKTEEAKPEKRTEEEKESDKTIDSYNLNKKFEEIKNKIDSGEIYDRG